jgi:hypothetical protein
MDLEKKSTFGDLAENCLENLISVYISQIKHFFSYNKHFAHAKNTAHYNLQLSLQIYFDINIVNELEKRFITVCIVTSSTWIYIWNKY